MTTSSYFKFYKVYLNGTSVTEVSTNDFVPDPHRQFKRGWVTGAKIDENSSVPSHRYSFPGGEDMFYGYSEKTQAMRMAKAGALKFIEVLIENAKESITKLKKYREEHYDDLNVSLLDRNIRDLEREMRIK